jgi:hypothetical protein
MEEKVMTSTLELAGDGGGSDDFNLGATCLLVLIRKKLNSVQIITIEHNP